MDTNPATKAMEVLSLDCAGLADILGVSQRAVYSWTGTGDSRREIPELARRVLWLIVDQPKIAKSLRESRRPAKKAAK